jgi:cell wall-associated NlpC family hydrolase
MTTDAARLDAGGRRNLRRVLVAIAVTGSMVLSLATLSTSTAAPNPDLQKVAQQVRDLQMDAGAATEDAKRAQAKLNDINSQLESIKNRASRERAELKASMETIDAIARAAYANGGLDPTLQVLMAEDPTEFLAQAAVMSQLEQNQVSQLRKTQTTRLRLAQTEAEIVDREAAAQQARDEMAAAQNKADSQLNAAQQVLNGLQADERQRLAQMAADRRAQQLAAAAAAEKANAASAGNGSSGNGSSGGGDAAGGGGFSGGSRAQIAVQYALAQVGEPYSYSARPPSSWDCSKLTTAAWGQAGVGISPLSYSQWDQTQRVPVSDIRPGDLVFYFGSGAHHVAMYIGNGKMVSASNPSDGVEITDFLGPWYGDRFSGVGRVVG